VAHASTRSSHTFCFTAPLPTHLAILTAVHTWLSTTLVLFTHNAEAAQEKGNHTKGQSKGKGKENEGDDDLNNMLANFRASDLSNSTITNMTTTTGSSSSSSSINNSSGISSTAFGIKVIEAMIIQASIRGDVAQVRQWAKLGVRVSSAEPLCQAVFYDKIGAVQCLAKELQCLAKELGADVNRSNEDYFTALFVAAQNGHLAVVWCLVENLSADVNLGDEEGCTPLFIAAQMGHVDVVRCLLDELGADVNQATNRGFTHLMVAAEYLHHTIVRYLLKHGADAQAVGECTELGTAADDSKRANAPAEETAYLQARMHCANLPAPTWDSRNVNVACKFTSAGVPAFGCTGRHTRRSVRRPLPS
jgi:hypothetical protein